MLTGIDGDSRWQWSLTGHCHLPGEHDHSLTRQAQLCSTTTKEKKWEKQLKSNHNLVSDLRNGHLRHLCEDQRHAEENLDGDVLKWIQNKQTFANMVNYHLVVQEGVFLHALLRFALRTIKEDIARVCLTILHFQTVCTCFALRVTLDDIVFLCKLQCITPSSDPIMEG